MDTVPLPDDSGLLARLKIVNREGGVVRARAARDHLLAAGKHVLGSAAAYTVQLVVFSGLFARAQGFDEGAVAAVEADNPYAAFTLIRAYAENAAAILYLKGNPGTLDLFWRDPDSPGIKPGKMTNYARKRFGGFDSIYQQLSQFAHPAARSILTSHRVANTEERTVEWRSAPSFKSDESAMIACAWLVELAEATAHLLVELAGSWAAAPPNVDR